jgi:hypothetical protein
MRRALLSILLLVPACRDGDREPGDLAELLASMPEPAPFGLDESRAAGLVELSLACVDREYPGKPDHVVDGDNTVLPPRELHPAFFGCYDWHSAVHGHWAMVRVLKTFPELDAGPRIRDTLDRHLTPGRIEGEVRYLEAERNRLFERPYGWGWLLRLQAELATWNDPDAERWRAALEPLASLVAQRTAEYLEVLSVPVREGTHSSTAYALIHVHDHACAVGNNELRSLVEKRARDFFLEDRSCPISYEPSGEDFISPCLVEADLMRRVLEPAEYVEWLERFLPPPTREGIGAVLTPPEVEDPTDPRIGHLVGLSFQRASSLASIASGLPAKDLRRALFERSSAIHAHHGIESMWEGGYGGEHWLATFAIYHLTGSGPY